MSVNGEKAEWFLPLAEPKPEGTGWPSCLLFASMQIGVRDKPVLVLGPPVHRDAIAAPLSAEARAMLKAVETYWPLRDTMQALENFRDISPHGVFHNAMRTYMATIAPPDPLAEAREAVARIRTTPPGTQTIEAVERALAALAKLGDR